MEVTISRLILSIVAIVVFIVVCRGIESLLRSRLIPRVANKYVLVTGCDSGFGNLVTRQLEKRGVHVFAACLTAKGQKELESQTSERVITLRLDVMDHDSIVSAFEFVKSKLPKDKGLWGLVNNAGIAFTPGLLEWCTRQDYERVIGVNLIGVIDVTITFMPLLRKAKGRVVNVASALARVASMCGGYAESKYGIEAFSDTLRRESMMMSYGVNVSILEPGFFRTRITDCEKVRGEMRESWNRLSDERKENYSSDLHEDLAEKCINFMNFVTSPNLLLVTNAMIHALLSQWPRTRYTCGADMKYIYLPLSYAPTWLSDRLLAFAFNRI